MAPEDWTNWLSIATAIHNDRKNITTGLSPNQILWGGEPHLMTSKGDNLKSQTIQQRLGTMKETRLYPITTINPSSTTQLIPPPSLIRPPPAQQRPHLP